MTITVPPVDNPSKEVPSEGESTTDAGAPGVGSSSGNPQPDLSAQVKNRVTQAKRYLTIAVEDVIKPSIKTFLETCDTNPRVAAIVATPALFAFLLVLAFFILSTLVLVLWSLLTITIGVFFVIVGGLISLFFKLLMVLLATIPMAGIAAALLVGANVASQFIIQKASQISLGGAVVNTGVPRAVRETDWKQIAERVVTMTTQGVRDVTPALLVVRDTFLVIGHALHSALQTALLALHKYEGEITASTGPAHQGSPTDSKKVDGDYSPVFIHSELDAGSASSSAESSAEGLKRRAPFPNVGGPETD